MKNLLYFVFLFCLPLNLISQGNFSTYFKDGSLRVDYILAGNNKGSEAFLQALKKEPFWGGPKSSLIDTMEYGEFLCKVFHEGSNKLIYSKGFSTLFQEWQTTKEASEVNKGFYQSTIIPFPKEIIRFEIYERNSKSEFVVKLSVKINPSDYFIQPSPESKFKVDSLLISGDPSHCVDIVFIPEGYTNNQMEKFRADVRRLTDSLFVVKPFSTYKNKFNMYAVMAPSLEEGADIPGDNLWKNTLLNSSFYTFDSERYLTTLDFWKVRDIAALAPCDQVYVIVNTNKYGGGGVYNHYSLTSAGNGLSPQVFIHEFGHGFAGLGDEYYDSEVSYTDFYPTSIEPWEPNLTTLVDFPSKWKNFVSPQTPVPTPAISKYNNTTGVFEGGGYVAKGVYRPAIDCRMKSNEPEDFCKICQYSIERMILFITQ
jgi:hypothetical protein